MTKQEAQMIAERLCLFPRYRDLLAGWIIGEVTTNNYLAALEIMEQIAEEAILRKEPTLREIK